MKLDVLHHHIPRTWHVPLAGLGAVSVFILGGLLGCAAGVLWLLSCLRMTT